MEVYDDRVFFFFFTLIGVSLLPWPLSGMFFSSLCVNCALYLINFCCCANMYKHILPNA